MSEHAAPRRHTSARSRVSPLRSVRLRAGLALGLVLVLGVSGTFAFWTDDVQITGTTLATGTLDINVKGGDPQATSTLSMTGMVPGNTVAEVLPVNNVGTAPAKYTMTGGLTGGNAADFNAAGAQGLLLTIRSGGTRTAGAGPLGTCGGGTVLVNDVPLTTTLATTILSKRPTAALAAATTPGTAVPAGIESLCVQIKLSDDAPSATLQGKTTGVAFTVTGTSDVS